MSVVAAGCQDTSVATEEVVVDLSRRGVEISPAMYGLFFEEINHAGDGGLYAELVQNRSFEEDVIPKGYRVDGLKLRPVARKYHLTGEVRDRSFEWHGGKVRAWSLKAGDPSAASMRLTQDRPKFATAPNNLEVTVRGSQSPVQVINEGYWGMGLKKGERYHLRTILRLAPGYRGTVVAKMLSASGDVLALAPVACPADGEWHDVKLVLTPSATDGKASLALEFNAPGKAWLDYVSLFPEQTFKQRPNGLRKDVAEMLAGLRPAFFRWPGGCVVEGITLDNRFEWKKTLGDPAARPGEYSTWGYRCSYGFGYYEMLQFCEDVGAKAMFVCNVGLGCQFRMGDASSEGDIPYYIQDCLDAIEYALGDTSTQWGARRAADGHPAPFPLQYVEIGNENWGPEYDRRFDLFYQAVKKKYPQLTLIYNEMPERNGPMQITKTDMVDPHYYVAPEFFFRNTDMFDDYERGKHTVYVGEYACNRGVGGGNMLAALSEAAFIGGMEKNGDLVRMASYAPLLENRNNRKWPTNLIWFDSEQVVGRASYYVQQMAAENKPTYTVPNDKVLKGAGTAAYPSGHVGFGSWMTQVEFKDIKLISGGKPVPLSLEDFSRRSGTWKYEGKVLSQVSNEAGTQYILNGVDSQDFVLECKARKMGGSEGFLLYFGMTGNGQDGYMYNIGGWGNSKVMLQQIANSNRGKVLAERPYEGLETGLWYDLKLIVSPHKSELYVNGVRMLSHEPAPVPLQFVASGYDEPRGELVLKVVNATETPYPVTFRLKGAGDVVPDGQVITLAADSALAENSFEEPRKITPVVSAYGDFGRKFTYEFRPFSYTILRIKAEKETLPET
jgi:alpha-L-arabinofuranosidase